jgi:NAD(P)-dependent dehydrogenase (short-subunit alcohol dehydrogenase family)
MEDFNGKVAVVTGGASGIGRSLVKELLAAGAKVFIGDVEQSALDRVLAEFEGLGDLRGQVTDVSTLCQCLGDHPQ